MNGASRAVRNAVMILPDTGMMIVVLIYLAIAALIMMRPEL